MKSEFSLSGKVILVTGGAGLIGSEICSAYLEYGATVVMADILPQAELDRRIARLAQRIPRAKAAGLHVDVTREASVRAAFRQLSERFRHLDVLVNAAALDAKLDRPAGSFDGVRFENYPLERWERSVAVNSTGLIRMTQAALRLMLPRRRGNIVNVASTYSLVAPNQSLYRVPGVTRPRYKPVDYVGSKSMVPNFSRYVATVYAREGIRCNTIAPHGVFNGHARGFQRNFERLSPLGRMCQVKELRGPFLFLASDASSYMTGSVLVVDGGWTAW